jgi:hypothetical protein
LPEEHKVKLELIKEELMKCKYCKAQWTSPEDPSLSSCPFCGKPLIVSTVSFAEDRPEQILVKIVNRFEISILGDQRLSGIIKDFMPNVDIKYKRIFAQAVKDGIGSRLLDLVHENTASRTAKLYTLKETFRQNNGFDHSADYVINCFLYALGWVDSVDEKKVSSVNTNVMDILKAQIDNAFKDGCFRKDEAMLIFSLAQQFGLSEDEIAGILKTRIKKENFKPSGSTDKSLESLRDIICACDWHSESCSYEKTENCSTRGKSTDLIEENIYDPYNLKRKAKSFREVVYEAVCYSENPQKGRIADISPCETHATYNSNGSIKEEISYTRKNFLRKTFSYDFKGYLVEVKRYKTDGDLTLKYQYKYNDTGKLISLSTYERDGSLLSEDTFKYDARGNRIEENYSLSKLSNHYDHADNLIEQKCYDSNSNLSFKSLFKYDIRGNKIEEKRYDPDGSLIFESTFKYDNRGNQIEEKRNESDGGFQLETYTYIYDERGNWISKTDYVDQIAIFITERKIEYNY